MVFWYISRSKSMNYIKFLNTKIYEWIPRNMKWKTEHLTRKRGVGVLFFTFLLWHIKTTVIRPTILYTFIDLMYALLASFTILTHDQRDEEKYWQLISTKQLWSVPNIVSSKSRTVQYWVPRCPGQYRNVQVSTKMFRYRDV
jgi:hypothetical protein